MIRAQLQVLTPATNGTNSQGTASQGAKGPPWQGLQLHKSGTIHTHSYAQTNKHMYNGSSLTHDHRLISFVINPLCAT